MATTYKILGQVSPSTGVETTLYTVPASTAAVGSSLIVTNRGTSTASFRVSVSAAGAATTSKDYIYYDLLIAGNDTFIATVGITLATTDVVRVYSSNASLSFQLYGSQIA